MSALFEFKSGKTSLHRLDPRCKFIIICVLGAGLIGATAPVCIALLLPALLLLKQLGITPAAFFGQLKFFILLLILIILARALVTPGTERFTAMGVSLSVPGLLQGGLVALRFFTVMVSGLIFCATTRPSDLKAAAQWFLAPVPFIPEKRAGMIISLSLRFLPMILSQAQASSRAMDARCSMGPKNGIRRLKILPLALLSKTVKKADQLSSAMDARCYTENRTDPGFCPGGKEPLALLLTAGFLVISFLLQAWP